MAKEHGKHLFCFRKLISTVKDHKRKRHDHDHDHHQKRRKLWGGRHETGSSSSVASKPSEDYVPESTKAPSACLEEPSHVPPANTNPPLGHRDDYADEPDADAPDIEEPGIEESDAEDSDVEEPFPGLAKIPRLLTSCFQNHDKSSAEYPGCEKPNGPFIEITLIDCKYRQLITTKSSIPYAALSYVWGPNPVPVPLLEGMKLAERVSRSIEDAMVVTQYLGMRYIWVDQYCVDQKDKEIKKRQISEMHEVYRHAELTIIAAVGGDAEAGLAPLCPISEAGTAWCDIDTDSASSVSSAETEAQGKRLASALDTIAGSVWNTRGWTYQESYVSRRIVVFHAGGVYYECSALAPYYREQTEVSETLQARDEYWTGRSLANGPTQRAFATGPHTELFSWLAYLVSAYSRRELTVQADTLPAFGAVLKTFDGLEWTPFADGDEWRDEEERWYIGIVQGLPFNYKPEAEKVIGSEAKNAKLDTSGLCWYHDIEGNRRRQQFPSWSWAGWYGPVSWNLPYGYADNLDKTVFQLKVTGFRATLGNERKMDLEEARTSPGPLVLCLESVAIPAKAFAIKKEYDEEHANDTLYMYGCAMPLGADESVTNINDTRWTLKRSYLSHADGTRQICRKTLREGLQEGIFKLMLIHVYQDSVNKLRFQAWILRKLVNDKGKPYYERIGGVNHLVMEDERSTVEERETFQKSLSSLVERKELERFDIF